jgi:hypothetical protein
MIKETIAIPLMGFKKNFKLFLKKYRKIYKKLAAIIVFEPEINKQIKPKVKQESLRANLLVVSPMNIFIKESKAKIVKLATAPEFLP